MQDGLFDLFIGNVLASLPRAPLDYRSEVEPGNPAHKNRIIVPWKELTRQLNFCLNTH
ncbi:MAG: hypothetical protein RQ982_09035 [Gammaproteobacteria bacterium]|nr:hypothetical protein [Gammaproteobacteria bacterium]